MNSVSKLIASMSALIASIALLWMAYVAHHSLVTGRIDVHVEHSGRLTEVHY